MFATLKNNQLITPGHDGAQFVVDVDGPGVYEVRMCRERGDVVEFGRGSVAVETWMLERIAGSRLFGLGIYHYRIEVLTLT